MTRGLTDKESLEGTMRQSRATRRVLNRVRELAAKGMHHPEQMTPDETRELCGSVYAEMDRLEAAHRPTLL